MTAAQMLGAALVAFPFLGLAGLCLHLGGLQMLVICFGGAGAIMASIAAGVWLLTH
jgi:hypothetical protein